MHWKRKLGSRLSPETDAIFRSSSEKRRLTIRSEGRGFLPRWVETGDLSVPTGRIWLLHHLSEPPRSHRSPRGCALLWRIIISIIIIITVGLHGKHTAELDSSQEISWRISRWSVQAWQVRRRPIQCNSCCIEKSHMAKYPYTLGTEKYAPKCFSYVYKTQPILIQFRMCRPEYICHRVGA